MRVPARIVPEDDPDAVVDLLLESGYEEEFCVSSSFDPRFISALAGAGFLVMAATLSGDPPLPLLLPKLHRSRSVLDFADLHESRGVVRLLPRYELRFDEAFEEVLDNCVAAHGADWLTAELTGALRALRGASAGNPGAVRPVSFALYRGGALVAGEFGMEAGGAYTSYSGYRSENSAGSVQLALTGRRLRDRGFSFWDLGMPLGYKERLGARTVGTAEFVRRFREARSKRPLPR